MLVKMDKNKAISYDMIANAGIIIDGALAGYEGVVDSMKAGSETVFDSVWSLIPFSGTLVKFTSKRIQKTLKANFVKIVNGSGGKDPKTYKESLHLQFEDAVENFRDQGLIDADAYARMSLIFKQNLCL